MNAAMARNAYRKSEENTNIHSIKLVHMMFDRSIAHLRQAEEAIGEDNPAKRGENLGKAIAIITELYSSVPTDQDTEAAVFLRSLYDAILTELPKVSAFGDREIMARALRYMEKLKEIWENTAMIELEADKKKTDTVYKVPQDSENLQLNQAIESAGLSFSI